MHHFEYQDPLPSPVRAVQPCASGQQSAEVHAQQIILRARTRMGQQRRDLEGSSPVEPSAARAPSVCEASSQPVVAAVRHRRSAAASTRLHRHLPGLPSSWSPRPSSLSGSAARRRVSPVPPLYRCCHHRRLRHHLRRWHRSAQLALPAPLAATSAAPLPPVCPTADLSRHRIAVSTVSTETGTQIQGQEEHMHSTVVSAHRQRRSQCTGQNPTGDSLHPARQPGWPAAMAAGSWRAESVRPPE